MRRHDWRLLGGSGGWEVWECRSCGRQTIPSMFGFLWPTVLQWPLKRFRCAPVSVSERSDER